MWRTIYGPGSWKAFLDRKDNKGLPLMEVRKKYLTEQLHFENFQSQQLAMLNGQGGGGKKPVATEPPSPGGKYELVEGGDEMYYWGDFDKVDNAFGDTYTTQVIAGVMYETTTVQQPPTFEGETSTMVPFTVYASDTEGTRVLKAFDQYGGPWLNEAQPFVIPTDLGYPDKDQTDFKPFVVSSPTQRALAYYGSVQTLVEAEINSLAEPIWYGDRSRSAGGNHYNVVVFPSKVTFAAAAGADWTKILDPQVDLMNITLTTVPGSTLDGLGYDGIQLQMVEENDADDADSLRWQGQLGNGNIILVAWGSLVSAGDRWIIYNLSTSQVTSTGPSTYDEVFTRDTGTVWDSTNGIASIEAY